MDIRRLTDRYAVAPQLDPQDMAALAEQGFTTVICNRPDDEVGPDHASDAMAEAARAAGLDFVLNPVSNGGMGPAQITAQAEALAKADGPTLAYCRSGTRSTFVWAFGVAPVMPVEDIVARAGEAGYDLSPVVPQLRALAGQSGAQG